ncbi:hypothetical protein SAY87_021920 [Trapa incisa]|uniref:Uncharacterized protein n=1 Tax=Trapa incisa TaxID=236973 RepID=A0AAN7PRI0_9MYRT|nr:hypothetical protein SAY87_021920 [Trapa incisa]
MVSRSKARRLLYPATHHLRNAAASIIFLLSFVFAVRSQNPIQPTTDTSEDRMLMHNALTNFVRLVSFRLLSITKKQCLIRYSSCSVMYEEPMNLPHPVTKKFLIE